MSTSPSIIRLPEVINKSGLSRSAIYDLISQDKFPKQIKLTSRSSGWIEAEISQWIDDKVSARDLVAEGSK